MRLVQLEEGGERLRLGSDPLYGLAGCPDAAWCSRLITSYRGLPRMPDISRTRCCHRYHERRASGRKVASPGLVVMGSVRVVAGLATRLRPDEGLQLPAGYVDRWQPTRTALAKRREARRQQRRFRRAPAIYLQELEGRAIQLSLLS